jgi:DNA-binding transcriptional regulator YiaG
MNNFAESLKTARKKAGLTQHGMADRMLIPFRTIQDWEGGHHEPPPYVQRFVLNELESLRKEKE